MLKGEGKGCGNSIGCNKRWKMIDAETDELAMAQAKETLDSYDGHEPEISEFIFIRSESLTANLKTFIEQKDAEEKQQAEALRAAEQVAEQQSNEEQERAEYERLKLKFG